jgi:hypothetical protein
MTSRTSLPPDDDAVTAPAVAETRAWVERAVIGLNLCPFARGAHGGNRTRYVGCAATDAEALLAAFASEVRLLLATPAETVETTLLVHPFVLNDFDDYNDFLDVADAALEALDATGTLQVASFHPDYRFADTAADDVTNATNRSPHPRLQLLREDRVERAVASLADSASIYEANLATLRGLGWAGWERIRAECRAAAVAPDVAPDRDA